jgi:hypothetical protein
MFASRIKLSFENHFFCLPTLSFDRMFLSFDPISINPVREYCETFASWSQIHGLSNIEKRIYQTLERSF